MKKALLFSALSALIFLSSCSLNRMAIRSMTPIFNNSVEALYEESDLALAEQAMAADLKLIDGMLKSDPNNKELLLLAAQGYAGYALGFCEDEDNERAKVFYLRAKEYALRVLRQNDDFRKAEKKDADSFSDVVKKMGAKNVPALFWAGFSWAGYINLSLDNPAALLSLPKTEILMNRVADLDSSYFDGAVYLYFGAVNGMKPRIMGGDPQKAKIFFDKNIALTQGKYMMAYVYMAKYYAAKILDEELFDEYLGKVIATPVDIMPGKELFTQIAKKKAKYLSAQKENIF
jgi:hypothetical protein